jgi:hypothetical protein
MKPILFFYLIYYKQLLPESRDYTLYDTVIKSNNSNTWLIRLIVNGWQLVKVQIKVILYMTVGAGIVLDTQRKLINYLIALKGK